MRNFHNNQFPFIPSVLSLDGKNRAVVSMWVSALIPVAPFQSGGSCEPVLSGAIRILIFIHAQLGMLCQGESKVQMTEKINKFWEGVKVFCPPLKNPPPEPVEVSWRYSIRKMELVHS